MMNTDTFKQTILETTSEPKPQPRVNYARASTLAYPAMRALQDAVNRSSVEKPLLGLIKLRASLLNHCAFCIDMHSREAKAAGESEERLYLLSAWEEAQLYTPRERAALRWTDVLTRLSSENGVSDEIFEEVRIHFDDRELADLTLAIVSINGWNRFCVGFKVPIRFAG
jgi:AhpD family alkylhydroperoxidase